MVETIIIDLIGLILTIAATLYIEKLRSPKLEFFEEDDSSGNLARDAPAKKIKLLRVKIINIDLPEVIRFLRREPAYHCRVTFQVFYHDNKKPLFEKPIPARWSHSDPPAITQLDSNTNKEISIFDWSKYNEIINHDCYTGIPEPIDIVARFDSDNECYIYNNDSFYPNYVNWKSENKKIPQGRYFLVVTAYYSGMKTYGYYELENNLSVDHFRLSLVSPSEIKSISSLLN